jgi:hypothetical protein
MHKLFCQTTYKGETDLFLVGLEHGWIMADELLLDAKQNLR